MHVHLCACEHVWVLEDIPHISACEEAKGQFVGISFLLLSHEAWGSNFIIFELNHLNGPSTTMISIATIQLYWNTQLSIEYSKMHKQCICLCSR